MAELNVFVTQKLMHFLEENGAVTFPVRVVPRSSKNEIVGEHDGALKVKIASPPVDGAANEELTRLLSKTFGVAKSSVEIVAGHTSKTKRIRINGVTAEKARKLIGGDPVFSVSHGFCGKPKVPDS